jgi:hypothetical protein
MGYDSKIFVLLHMVENVMDKRKWQERAGSGVLYLTVGDQ